MEREHLRKKKTRGKMNRPENRTDGRTVSAGGKRIRVLVCDDKKLIRSMISRILVPADYEVEAAASPAEGIALFKSNPFEVVITDVSTEPVDGFAFREMLRAIDRTVPIVFLTGRICGSDHDLLNTIMQDPRSYFLPKQSGRQLMLNKLDQILSACRAEYPRDAAQEHRVGEELALAGSIQRALLPPNVYSGDHFEYSCLYRPLHKISGDLYEHLPVSGTSGMVIFGDLSGHGIHSALAMTAVLSFLKNVSLEQENLPCMLARELNAFLCRQLHGLVYMCALIIRYDFEANIIQYYNSGMGELFCVNARTGELRELNPEKKGSVPLGIMPECVFEREDTVEVRIEDGECFIAISDGICDLSRSADGSDGMDMDFFRDLLSRAVMQIGEEGDIVALPFQIYSMLELGGYMFAQDDAMLMAIRGKTGNPVAAAPGEFTAEPALPTV